MGFESKYELKEPSERTKKRIIEVLFYLSFKPLYGYLKQVSRPKGIDLAEEFFYLIGEICGVGPMPLHVGFSHLYNRHSQPTKREMVLTLRYLGVPYKKITTLYGISHVTILKYLQEYIQDGQVGLVPRIDIEYHQQIQKCLTTITSFLLPIGEICSILNSTKWSDLLEE
jgi:hypothetical protein